MYSSFLDWDVFQRLWKQGEVAFYWQNAWGEGLLFCWQVCTLPVGDQNWENGSWRDMKTFGVIWTLDMNYGI